MVHSDYVSQEGIADKAINKIVSRVALELFKWEAVLQSVFATEALMSSGGDKTLNYASYICCREVAVAALAVDPTSYCRWHVSIMGFFFKYSEA